MFSKTRRTLSAALVSVVVLIGAPLTTDTASGDDVPVHKRITCPSVAALQPYYSNATAKLTRVVATPTRCAYYAPTGLNGEENPAITFAFDPAATPAEAQARIAAEWPDESPYPFQPIPVPQLGAGAFMWADASPLFMYWQVSPGATGFLSGARSYEAARLFRPMMEVYTLPGERRVNGRDWRTTCEPYSQTARCRTEIWATVIKRDGDRYIRTDGWAFNSLTYRWSDRSLWKGNPLGENRTWTTPEGRQWRTECDTANTGRGACRSYLRTTVVSWTSSGYRQSNEWVFNNQVLFNA